MKRNIFSVLISFLCSCLTVPAQFVNSGNFKIAPNASVSFFGDLTNNNSFIDSGLVVAMAGNVTQTISGTSVITFNNLTLNNSSALGVTLAQAVNVRGNLAMATGVLYTTSINILNLTNGATSAGTSNNSFVSGPMNKIGNQTFTFPVGKNLVCAPITIAAPSLVTDVFTAEYFETDPDPFYSRSNKDLTLDHISLCEYWSLTRTAGVSNVTVKLSWAARSCGVTNLNDLRLAGWDGTTWKDHGNGGTTGTLASGTVLSFGAITSFGPFALASSSTNNPLPIELISFTGQCSGQNVSLSWSTATESDNDYFTAERSTDASNWSELGNVDGAGNSVITHNYSFTDVAAVKAVSYYRLKQTDFNGGSHFSQIISVKNCRTSVSEDDFVIYPNPSQGVFDIIFSGDNGSIRFMEIFNSSGERIYYSDTFLSPIDISKEPIGAYFIRFNFKSIVIIKKIILQK